MCKFVRKTMIFTPAMHEQIKAYGAKRGCCNFTEAIRDIVRTVLAPVHSRQKNDTGDRDASWIWA